MKYTVPIKNLSIVPPQRVFDVIIDSKGNRIKYVTKNIKGIAEVTDADVEYQIREFLCTLKMPS